MTWLYPAIIGLAMLTGLAVSRATKSSLPLDPRQRLAVLAGAFIGAMFGAKLPFVLSDWEGFVSGAAWFTDGKTILTGLVGGYFGVVVAKWCLNIHARTGDSFAAPVAATVAVGRLACFVRGCCYGKPTTLPWGVVFEEHGPHPRHPTQLYEAAFHAVAACVLFELRRRGLFRGNLMKLYIIAYCGFRFATEYLRDEIPLWLGLTGYQWASLLIAALFAWLWRRDAHEVGVAVSARECRGNGPLPSPPRKGE